MRAIIAIWWGEIWWIANWKQTKIETKSIDEEIIKLSNNLKPNVLFIPTASWDNEWYINKFKNYYWNNLWCNVNILRLIWKKINNITIKNNILNSDIIYVWWWNTLKMMKIWRKLWIDNILLQAYNKWIIMTWLSAGAICWFKYGLSDSLRFRNHNAKLIKVRWLNFLNALLSPHCNREKDRLIVLSNLMKKTPWIAIALDDCTAITIINDKYKILKSNKEANAYKIFYKKWQIYKEILNNWYLNQLLKK